MRGRLIAAAAATGVALVLALVPGASAAPTCTPTDYFRDGHFLTAAHVAVAGEVITGSQDAGGCDISIYVEVPGVQVTSADVSDARYYGVLVNGSGSSATVSNSHVHDIGDIVDGAFNGSQHGVGLEYVDGAAGTIDGTLIERYQKGGVVASGSGTQLDTLNSTVRGLGPVPYIAQNGVQYSNFAAGTVRGNTITDNEYTGCSRQQSRTGSCTYYESVGLLLININPPDVGRSMNLYRNDDSNLVVWPASAYANASS